MRNALLLCLGLAACSTGTRPAAPPAPAARLDAYGGTTAITGTKTGFFHTQEIDGRWFLIDPEGNGFIVIGMDGFGHYPSSDQGRGWQGRSPELDAFDGLLKEKYPDKSDWAKAQLSRIHGMGFNTMLNSIRAYPDMKYPRTEIAGVSGRGEKLKDVFAADFAERVKTVAETRCRPNAANPFLIGYFSDNELPWAKVWGGGFLDEYLSLSAGAAGSAEALQFVRRRFGDIAAFNAAWNTTYADFDAIASKGAFAPGPRFDRQKAQQARSDFLEIVARRYYSIVYQAFKKADPNHLVMGTRFLTGDVPLAVARAMKGNVDVVSTNAYAVRTFPVEFFSAFSREAGAPMVITEFGYSAFDSGLPMDHPGAIPRVVETQRDRADRYEWYLDCIAARPELVGASWWWYLDGFGGVSRGNFGFVSWKDELWRELGDRAAKVNGELYGKIVGRSATCKAPPKTAYPIRRVAGLALDGDPGKVPGFDIHLDKSLKYEGHGFDQAGLRADAAVLVDRDDLCVSVRVFDRDVKTYSKGEVEKSKTNIWELDGVELRLGWIQALLTFDDRKPVIQFVPTDPMPEVQAAGRILADGYFLQARIPLEDLRGVIEKGEVPLAIGVNDGRAGERLRQLQWPASYEWIYVETYARAKLP